jgi:nucleoside-diphosphate-sugar epimerase
MSVLVLGGAGYIGAPLCHFLLRKGRRVVCVDSLRYGNVEALGGLWGVPGFTFVQADIRDIESYRAHLKTADAVVNLAALVGAPVCDKFPEEALEVNQVAVHHLVKALSPNQRLIYTNSNSGYGATDGTSEVDENSPLTPLSVYARTKCEGEKAVLEHPDSVSFRLATVFGVSPRMRFDLLVNDWTRRLVRLGEIAKQPELHSFPVFRIFEPTFCRNYVHVQDVVRAIFHALEHSWGPFALRGVYNCGNPDANRTKWELAQTICKEIGLDECVLAVDPQSKDPDGRNYRVSNAKLLGTGFLFRHILEEGILEVARYVSLLNRERVHEMGNV